jgi:alpha-L-fucosidase
MTMNRRRFVGASLGLACLGGAHRVTAGDAKPYVRANTDWLAKCRYGIGIHWTAQTVPRKGKPLPFQEAVDAFDVKRLVERLAYAGADYLLFTSTHALQMLAAPHPVIDRLLPGRTCKRDLIAELADALAAKGMSLLVYYNHSCNGKDDPEWRKAVGYDGTDKNVLARNLLEIVGWMGERYQEKIKAWWFDSPYSLDLRGPHHSVTTDMRGFQFPWERFTVAAKRGYPARLVTYNAGVNETFLYTTHQDYWAGELVDLNHPPTGRYHPANGLQWFGWACLEDRAWVHHRLDTEIPKPLYSDDELIRFVRTCNRHQAPMTFNVGIYQDGTMAEASIEQLHRMGAALRGT